MYKSHICQNLGQKHFKNKYRPLCIRRQIWSLIFTDIKTHEISKIDYKGIFKFIGLMTIVSPNYAFRIMISFSQKNFFGLILPWKLVSVSLYRKFTMKILMININYLTVNMRLLTGNKQYSLCIVLRQNLTKKNKDKYNLSCILQR